MRRWGACGVAIWVLGVPSVAWLVAACGSSHGGSAGDGMGDGAAANPDATLDGAGGSSDGGSVMRDGDSSSYFDGGDGAALQDAAPIPLGDLCPLFTKDLCTYLMQCDKAPYRDLAHCEAELDCYGLPQLQAAAAEGGVLYDPAQVGACNARFQADPCAFGFFLFTPDIFQVLKLCPGTLTPLLEAGAPCVSSGECTQGLYCKKGSGCPGACTPYSKVGESCVGSAQCDPALTCVSATTGPFTDVCAFAPEAGAPCNGSCGSTENCPNDPTPCYQNFWCDSNTHTCKAGVGLGAACGPQDGGGSIACASNLWCSQVFLDKPGTCLASGEAGAPCNDLGCQPGLHCAGYVALGPDAGLGACTGQSPSGGPCRVPSDCQGAGDGGAYCGNGICGGGLGPDASCNQDTDCQSGLTCASHACARGVYPGDSCDAGATACVLSLCRSGICVDHAKVGQACSMNSDCATGTCYQGFCADTSVCPVP